MLIWPQIYIAVYINPIVLAYDNKINTIKINILNVNLNTGSESCHFPKYWGNEG